VNAATSIFGDRVVVIDRYHVSKLYREPLDKFIGTLKKYKPYIVNYFKRRWNSGFVEGLNNKIRVVKRRCYGFFNNESLFQRLYLDLKGYAMIA
jgi:transposase